MVSTISFMNTAHKVEITQKKLLFFGAVGIALCILVFFLFFLQKKTYITVDLFVSGGEWWWVTPDPPYWITNPVVRGAAEYDVSGRKVVDVLSVEKFDQPYRKTLVVRARLLVTKNLRTQKYRFKQAPLEIGSTISISPGNVELYANVMGIEGVQDLSPKTTRRVTARWYNVFPWQADAVSVGDVAKDGSGQAIATVVSKQVDVAEKTVVTENNQTTSGTLTKATGQLVLLRSDPLRRDVTLTLDLQVRQIDGQEYFSVVQNVKVGESLYVSLPKIFITPVTISIDK